MLRHLALRNFKGFADAEAPIAPFTLLVGANATGKSNLLDALRFLHGIAQGWPVRDVAAGRFEGTTRVWPGIRGGSGEIVRIGTATAAIETRWTHVLGDGCDHRVEFDGTSIVRESLGNRFAAVAADGSGDLAVTWLDGSMERFDSPPRIELVPAGVSALCSRRASNNAFVTPFRRTLADIAFAEQSPAIMRDYVEMPRAGARVRPDASGRNLSSVLWQLCQDENSRAEIVDWLVEFCAPEIADLEFEQTDSGYVMLRIVERDGRRISARSMSDGTLRFLALLVTLKASTSTLVVEDLEHGLHPSRLHLLVEAIRACTEPRLPDASAPVVVGTTHSPALVEAALEIPHCNVLLCARVAGMEGTVIRDVRSLPDFDAVRKRRDFAYLVNTGWLERAV
ncbi:MAG: hypothetical protein FJ265_14230 [Planctomycetes bacterium]|nr:hypothetical protein [Planctomycetota bacterium]